MISDEELSSRLGMESVSAWVTIDQALIDRFAEATDDHQFIHTDPHAARETQFGGTIAHGFLTLSLLPAMNRTMEPALAMPCKAAINYGGNRVRFPSPVRSGKRVRARGKVVGIERSAPDQIRQTVAYVIEIEHETKPAMAAEWITVFIV